MIGQQAFSPFNREGKQKDQQMPQFTEEEKH